MPFITISGEHYRIEHPYKEGHVLTEAEARALNAQRLSYIGTQVRKRIQSNPQWSRLEIEAEVNYLDKTYRFAPQRNAPCDTAIAQLTMTIARQHAQAYLRQRQAEGLIESFDQIDVGALAMRLALEEGVQREAQEQLKIQQRIARQSLDEIF